MSSVLALAIALVAFQQAGPQPLRVQTGVAPETVTVGDRFRSVVRIHLPPGTTARFPPLRVDDPVSAVDTPGLTRQGPDVVSATYPLVAWVAGEPIEASVLVRLARGSDPPVEHRIPLRLPVVASVLPADSATLEPRPPRPLLALPRARRPARLGWVVAGLLLALATAVAWHRGKRRRGVPGPAGDPRQEALARLDALLRRGEQKDLPGEVYYVEASRVLRSFLYETEPRWSEDLSSAELLALLEREVPAARDAGLEALLAEADTAKFAGRGLFDVEAREFAVRVREWIASFRGDGVAREEAVAA